MSTRAAVVISPVLFVLATIALMLGLTLACSGPGENPEPRAGETRLTESHTIGLPVVAGNLTVWPVFADDPVDLGDFSTLADALKSGTVEIREVGGGSQRVATLNDLPNDIPEGIPDIDIPEMQPGQTMSVSEFERRIRENRGDGTVPVVVPENGATVGTLVIENRGDIPLLVCAGTIVKGGNQDRQIGEDIIIQAKSSVPVEAFCVEQGRWAGNRMGDVTLGKFVVATSNATKGVREKGQYLKAQGEVWNEVASTKARWRHAFRDAEVAGLPQATNARAVEGSTSFAVLLDANREVAGKEFAALGEAVRAHFENHGAGAVGFAYAVDGKVVSVRAFLNAKVFQKQFDPFLESMVAEAWIARQGKPDSPAVAGKTADVVALVAAMESAEEKTAETRGLNLNGIRMNDRGYNGNCYLPVAGRKVAVTQDWSSK